MDVRSELTKIGMEVKNLSQYDGQDYGYDGEDYGFDGDAGFSGAKGVAAKRPGGSGALAQRALNFKFSITNKGTTPLQRRIAISPAMFDTEAELTAAGYAVAGILRDGQVVPGATVGTNDVVATALRTGLPIAMLKNFRKSNPVRLIGMAIESDATDQFATDLTVVTLSPFKKPEENYIDLGDYYSPDQLATKKIECDFINDGVDFSFDDQNLILMDILPGRQLIVTLRFGGVDNAAGKFDNRARTNGDSRVMERGIARGSKRK